MKAKEKERERGNPKIEGKPARANVSRVKAKPITLSNWTQRPVSVRQQTKLSRAG